MGKHVYRPNYSIDGLRDRYRNQKRYWLNRWRWFLKPATKKKLHKATKNVAQWFHN